MKLPKELIEDFENNVTIVNLCKKYGLTYFIIRNELKKLGLIKKNIWGGRREGCGRKKMEKSGELERIRERNKEINKRFARQPGETRAVIRSSKLYRSTYYEGGF